MEYKRSKELKNKILGGGHTFHEIQALKREDAKKFKAKSMSRALKAKIE